MRNFASLPLLGLLLLVAGDAWAQQRPSPLSDQGRAEFDRIFGSTPSAHTAVSTRLSRETFPSTLPASQMAVALTRVANPATIRSLSQLQLLFDIAGAPHPVEPTLAFHYWHAIALDTTSNDHAPVTAARGIGPAYQQIGPARTSRALAILHIGMFEAINLLKPDGRKYSSYLYGSTDQHYTAPPQIAQGDDDDEVVAAAINEVAYTLLANLYPGLKAPLGPDNPPRNCRPEGEDRPFSLDSYYACFSRRYADADRGKFARGSVIGHAIALSMIERRADDKAAEPERSIGVDFEFRVTPDDESPPVSQWNSDPVSKIKTALGASWAAVTPFAMLSAQEFRRDPTYIADYRNQLDADKFTRLPSFGAVKQWGCDAFYNFDQPGLHCLNGAYNKTGTKDYRETYLVAKFWAYDGTAGLCAPGRLYNEIIDRIFAKLDDSGTEQTVFATRDLSKPVDRARLYALANAAMADAAIAAWDTKYHVQFPRPVTVIREQMRLEAAAKADAHKPEADYPPTWFPVGAQVSNSDGGVNVTPPFPAYVSGHATFGGALFGILRQFFDPQRTKFPFLSDEFNGYNKDAQNYIRCRPGDPYLIAKFCADRSFTFDCAERENADSRLVMGVHWVFDADDGILMGNRVAARAYNTLFVDEAQTMSRRTYSADPGANRDTLLCDVKWPVDWSAMMDDPTSAPFHPRPVDDSNFDNAKAFD